MHSKKIQEVLDELKTSEHGLSENSVHSRFLRYGPNELEKTKKESLIKCFFKQFLNIMVGILLFSAIVSISFAIAKKDYTDLFEGLVILFIVFMNALIGVFQESKAQACLADLQKYSKINVKVLRDGKHEIIDSTKLVIGDIVELEAGNVVSADIRLIQSNNLSCDESALTGESLSAEKNADIVCKNSTILSERKNMAYSGSMVTSGKAVGVVVATGKNTEIGKIANLIFKSKKEKTPLQKSIDKIGKSITWTVVVVCVVIMTIELISRHSFMDATMTSVALAVAAIPESLPAVITIILALGVQQLAKRRCIIKHLHAVETLGSCQIICTDKTGTLTLNKLQVVSTYSNFSFDDNGHEFNDLILCMTLCNNATISNGTFQGEPTEVALCEYGFSHGGKINKKIIKEIPFDSTRKMMSKIFFDKKFINYCKGAPEKIIKNCKFIKINDEICEFSNELKEKVIKANDNMTDNALRVVGFAYKEFERFNPQDDVETDMVFIGLAGLMDKPRPEVKASIKKCFKAGLKPIMITGDHKRTAFAIAKDLCIANNINEVITGEELDKLTDDELKKVCQNYRVFARVTPEHKVRIVNAYKGNKRIVAMTGDGVNDAPSLKIADIGIGMGKSGTDVVKNVADMIITDDNFSSIIVAVEEGRKIYHNIQKVLQFLISTNCVEVFGMLIALLFFPKYIFLTPVQMLFINLVTDSLPAFALGVEKVESGIMSSPPRDPHAGLFSGKVVISIIYQSILQTVIALVVFVIGLKCYSPEQASTMVFLTIVFMQTLHSVNCKNSGSIFEINLFDNKTFNLCFAITMVLNLIVACVPFMYRLFGLEFLNLSQWIIVIIASIIIIPTCELFKAILIKEDKLKPDKKIKKSKIIIENS